MTGRETPDTRPPTSRAEAPRQLSRRALLGAAAVGSAAFVAGRIGGPLLSPSSPDMPTAVAEPPPAPVAYPFFGAHQAGVATPHQRHLHFAAFDMLDGAGRADVAGLLRDWSTAVERMTRGLPVGPTSASRSDGAPPADTGEAAGMPSSALTVTIGFGPTLFERDGVDRYGIAGVRPVALERLPAFTGDALDAARCDGDLAVQVCADDPQVAVHAIHNLSRLAIGRAAIRWSQQGFVGTPSAAGGSGPAGAGPTPRNLMGFKDGTNNILGANDAVVEQHVWLPRSSTPTWLIGGTYLVIRKIAICLQEWDERSLAEQEASIGRSKAVGAPLSGGEESSAPDFEATLDGSPAIRADAHVRLAHPSSNDGVRILRRGYNYVDGTNVQGHLEAGLVFISYQRSPEQFIAIQRRLSSDRLNAFTRHVGSGVFAVPPGATAGGYVGETLLG